VPDREKYRAKGRHTKGRFSKLAAAGRRLISGPTQSPWPDRGKIMPTTKVEKWRRVNGHGPGICRLDSHLNWGIEESGKGHLAAKPLNQLPIPSCRFHNRGPCRCRAPVQANGLFRVKLESLVGGWHGCLECPLFLTNNHLGWWPWWRLSGNRFAPPGDASRLGLPPTGRLCYAKLPAWWPRLNLKVFLEWFSPP